jgi:hypothetical protein
MSCARTSLTRALFALAGTVTLVSIAPAALVSPWFLLLAAFVGLSQWMYVPIGQCPASLALSRAPFIAKDGAR